MNLLLLLSALLSAITGTNVSGRAPQAMTELATVAACTAAVAAVTPVVRPIAALPTLPALAAAPPAAGLVLAPAQPIYAGRRRQ